MGLPIKSVAFVLTQTPARSFRIREAAAALAKLGDVCSVSVVTRNTYQDAQGLGLGVVEFEPKGKQMRPKGSGNGFKGK